MSKPPANAARKPKRAAAIRLAIPSEAFRRSSRPSKQKTHRYALCSANRRSISLTKSSKRLRQTSMPGRPRRRALIFRTRSRKRLSDPLAPGVELPGARSLHRRPLRSRWFAYLEWRPFQAFGFLTKPGKIEAPDSHDESCNYVQGNCHAFLLPFTVRRSPFTVHRSPFTVHRSQGAVRT